MSAVALNKTLLPLGLLLMAVTATALALAYVKHLQRQAITEQAQLQRLRLDLDREWARLQLEEAAAATPGRIERLARERLGMRLPGEADIWVLRP